MKKILKIMSVILLTTFTTTNITACDLFQKSPQTDWNERLNDAAQIISTTTDVKFKTFLYDKNKTQTKVSFFSENIINRIENLLHNSTKDYSLLIYHITNLEDKITNNTSIKLELSVYDNPNIKKTCSFVANFTDMQSFVNKELYSYTNAQKTNKQYFTLNKKDQTSENNSFYETLIGYGAKFKQIIPKKPNTFKTSDSGQLGKASVFWDDFKTAKGDGKTTLGYLGNVLYPIFQLFNLDDMGGLTFFNFEASLQTHDDSNNVIALTGHKNFGGQSYDYIEINIKGVKTNDVDLSNSFNGLTYIFK